MDVYGLGHILFKAHDGMKNQFKISCKELDFLVDYALNNQDVVGARMMGGGFGGCTINLVKKSATAIYKKQISKSYADTFGFNCSIYHVKLSNGTQLINEL